MVDRGRRYNVALDFAQRLICEALQPEYPSERNTRRHALIELEAHGIGPANRRRVTAEHALYAVTRAGLVSQEMQRRSRHTLADQLVDDIARPLRKAVELARDCQRLPKFGVIGAIGPERPKRPKLIVGVSELLGEP